MRLMCDTPVGATGAHRTRRDSSQRTNKAGGPTHPVTARVLTWTARSRTTLRPARWLDVAQLAQVLELVHQVFDLLGPVSRTDQNRIRGVHDDQIAYAQGRHEPTGVRDHDQTLGFPEQYAGLLHGLLADDGVAGRVGRQ